MGGLHVYIIGLILLAMIFKSETAEHNSVMSLL